jgi:hypothetical protein
MMTMLMVNSRQKAHSPPSRVQRIMTSFSSSSEKHERKTLLKKIKIKPLRKDKMELL